MEAWVAEQVARWIGAPDRLRLARPEEVLEPRDAGGVPTYRVVRPAPPLGVGLVVTRSGVIPEAAPIRRVFDLRRAIAKYYYGPFYLEEEVAGAHLRIACIDGQLRAFTRDGNWCPFASDRARDLLPAGLFEERPDTVPCVVVSGQGTPYALPSEAPEGEEIRVWVVDLLEWNVREPLGPDERYRLCSAHGLPAVRHAGPFTARDLGAVGRWARELEEAGGLGVVVKPRERHHRPVKWATLAGALGHVTLREYLEGNANPVGQRLLRAACAAVAEGRGSVACDWEAVGRALLAPLLAAAEQIAGGGVLRQDRSVWLHCREAAEAIMQHLESEAPEVSVELIDLSPEEGGWRLRFARTYRRASTELASRLAGASFRE